MKSSTSPYEIATDRQRLDRHAIHAYLTRSYWSPGVAFDAVDRAIDNSLCFGIFSAAGEQVGFARVITDKAAFAYLCDVYVLEPHRGQGLSKRLLRTVRAHPDLQEVRWFLLATRDAHPLYEKFGFRTLASPSSMMELRGENEVVPGAPGTTSDE